MFIPPHHYRRHSQALVSCLHVFMRCHSLITRHHFRLLRPHTVRADLGGHLKYSQRWSGVRAGVLLGAQGAVRRGESRGGL